MALKKFELYSLLWSSCDELRGGMDARQYKDYVLVLLFVKYVSDKYAGQPFAPITIPAGSSPVLQRSLFSPLRPLRQRSSRWPSASWFCRSTQRKLVRVR